MTPAVVVNEYVIVQNSNNKFVWVIILYYYREFNFVYLNFEVELKWPEIYCLELGV
jgi:hypothetical protein